ncbi:3-hydroxyacyl-CoA dehydrogenase /Enoyl-CoA hydratase [Archaeoglobus sulfaticallidus PM70-1]|uniref:3-hydroxyacyl-CoA dehydrogenase /Enoyl-CoA hydratase n=1 Tax=Archaeoglobus sulfaticallidus PM70-1 TaxID=387631 RepID=N0BMC3_9EURY|nr:3-hydroxyacyl-CoA dehydrogenase/enoyl-CoA hydratase family protein [Archaeoglobus sulfaticallidus]AGK61420.1 3-hydroxyacyl-CoA dehydrogenase /Enoyl-CoA hydratase [Archaeoglobus sulfaticallidus PM70-1]
MKKIAVLGAGAMGHGIAYVSALAGYDVWVRDIDQKFLDKALENIKKMLEKAVAKGKMKEEKAKEVLDRLHFTLDMKEAIEGAELVIEAVPEIMDLKKKVFEEVQKYASPECYFATNTSGLSITEIANITDRPEKFMGLHFFNPVPIMQLVEVIKGEKTADSTIEYGVNFVKSIGKTPVVVKKDVEGFIVNRCLVPYLALAIDDVGRGVATKEEIDATMKYKYAFPMGPIELGDFVGLDILYYGGEQWSLVPNADILKEKIEKKELGMKTGRGFYDWSKGRPEIPKELAGKYDALRLIAPMVNIASGLIEMGVASAEEIDLAMKLGTNMPKGPCELGDEIGLDVILKKLEELYEEKKLDVLKPTELLKKMVAEGKLGKKSGEGFYSYKAGEVTFKNIIVEKDDKIAKIILNRPHRLNALSFELLDELEMALKQLAKDESRVLIITGSGDKAFSAGFDLQEALADPSTLRPANSAMVAARGQEVFTLIERFPKPVIAAINGYAFGGGCELTLACDFRIMSKAGKIGLTETAIGLIPGWGGTQRMAKLIGLAKAKELIFLAKRLTADEAEAIGLVNKAVDPDKFWDEVMALANALAEMPPISLRVAKYAINYGYELPVEVGQAIEAAYFGIATSTEDVMEGVRAFFERRKPEFKGR